MGDAADDSRDQMEQRELDYYLHKNKRCFPDCPYCQIEKENIISKRNYNENL